MSKFLSLSRQRARLRSGEQAGFSLIELMVVLLIIAILLAVAIPTYLSARNRAENRAAQETIAHTFVAAKAVYASQNDFTPLDGASSLAAYLTTQNPGVTVTSATAVSKTNEVSEAHGAQSITLAAWAPDGKCFYLADVESSGSAKITGTTGSGTINAPGTYYGESKSGGAASSGTATGCTASFTAPTSGWQTSWAAASAGA